MIVWTSLGQDGSWEGVYGQYLAGDGSPLGAEFRVNSTTLSRQLHSSVASDGVGRFLVTWSSFVDVANGFDLFGQRYAATTQLTPPSRPMVTVVSSNALAVSWPPLAGFNVADYEIYADGAVTATVAVTNTWWTMTGLDPSSTHWFQIDYLLTDGRRSPLSSPATNTTYSTMSWGGIPYDWMTRYFGNDAFTWSAPSADADGDGVSNLNEFLAGTDPTNANSVLRIRMQQTDQGLFLNWNTVPGLVYQVQVSGSSLNDWSNLGKPRFAPGIVDSLYVGASNSGFYRVVRLR